MKKSVLFLEMVTEANNLSVCRTIFKTEHGRAIFLELEIQGLTSTIRSCFYVDRNQGKLDTARYQAKPKRLKTLHFPLTKLLDVIASELDKQFYGVEFIQSEQGSLSTDEYIKAWLETSNQKYRFLVMVGSGESHDGLPVILRTRLKNKLHRSIYVRLEYYGDGKGVVKECCYYDRTYKRQDIQITPPMLTSCFFPYTREGILKLFNNELFCNFTHLLVADGINVDLNKTPLCGAI